MRLGDFRMVVDGMWRAIDDDVPQEEARIRVSVRWKKRRRRFQCVVYRDVLMPHTDSPDYQGSVANRITHDFIYLLGLCFRNEPQRLFLELDRIAHFDPQRLAHPTAPRVCQGLAQIGAVAKVLLTAYKALDAAVVNYFINRAEPLAKVLPLVGDALIAFAAFACDQCGVELGLAIAVKNRLESAA
jgi:hypothetical protein